MIHTVKGFGVVNKAEVDVFLELSLSSGCLFKYLVVYTLLLSFLQLFLFLPLLIII